MDQKISLIFSSTITVLAALSSRTICTPGKLIRELITRLYSAYIHHLPFGRAVYVISRSKTSMSRRFAVQEVGGNFGNMTDAPYTYVINII